MANGAPISLTPQFQRFGLPAQAPFEQPQPQTSGLRFNLNNPLSQALGAAGRGLIEGGSRGGLGMALLGATSAGIPAFAQAQQLQQQQAQQQAAAQAAAQQQALENLQAQRAADLAQARFRQDQKEFGVTSDLGERQEQRLGQTAAGQLEIGRGNLALRGQEFARGRVDPLVEVFDNTSPTGSTLMPRSQAVGQAGVGSFAGSGLTPGKAEELTASAGGLRLAQTKLSALRDDLAANPQRAGAIGSVNKALQTGGGILRDLADVIPGVSGIAEAMLGPVVATESQEVQDFLNDPSMAANQGAANSLAYAVALSRKQGKRVTVQDINTAKDDLQITGLKSSKQVVARMDELLREIDQGIGLIEQRVAGAPGGGAQAATQQAEPVFRIEGGALVPVQ